MDNELTATQANDVARYFLGRGWVASSDGIATCTLRNGDGVIIHESSWRLAFRAAGVKLPSRSQFTASGLVVRQDDRMVANAVSANFAKRIAAALNRHTPDKRGI